MENDSEEYDEVDYNIPFYNVSFSELPNNLRHYITPSKIVELLNELYEAKGLIHIFSYYKSFNYHMLDIISVTKANIIDLETHFKNEAIKYLKTDKFNLYHETNQTLAANNYNVLMYFLYPTALKKLNNTIFNYTTLTLEQFRDLFSPSSLMIFMFGKVETEVCLFSNPEQLHLFIVRRQLWNYDFIRNKEIYYKIFAGDFGLIEFTLQFTSTEELEKFLNLITVQLPILIFDSSFMCDLYYDFLGLFKKRMAKNVWIQKVGDLSAVETDIFRVLDESGRSFILFNTLKNEHILDFLCEMNYLEKPYSYLEPTMVRVSRKRKNIEIEIE